jgi:hypothetical protein
MSMSMDCFLLGMAGDIPVTYFKLIWLLLNPMIYVSIAVLYYVSLLIGSKLSSKFKNVEKKVS